MRGGYLAVYLGNLMNDCLVSALPSSEIPTLAPGRIRFRFSLSQWGRRSRHHLLRFLVPVSLSRYGTSGWTVRLRDTPVEGSSNLIRTLGAPLLLEYSRPVGSGGPEALGRVSQWASLPPSVR
ncbi:hypothetical protein NMY22_g14128 [Coprinellus aureogranulatus]|nr:hypothetical protein NMY22_g14128 [Coprinellus aureogranulatus]